MTKDNVIHFKPRNVLRQGLVSMKLEIPHAENGFIGDILGIHIKPGKKRAALYLSEAEPGRTINEIAEVRALVRFLWENLPEKTFHEIPYEIFRLKHGGYKK